MRILPMCGPAITKETMISTCAIMMICIYCLLIQNFVEDRIFTQFLTRDSLGERMTFK
jgi:hypothetical protein